MSKEELLIKLGVRIVELRKARGLSQAEFARRCFKDKQSIERVESGKINPSVFYLYEISLGLEITLCDLLDF